MINKDGKEWVMAPVEASTSMHNPARDWSTVKYGKPIGQDASDGCYRAMISCRPPYEISEQDVERSARAICKERDFDPDALIYPGKTFWQSCIPDARAAIRAFLGEG